MPGWILTGVVHDSLPWCLANPLLYSRLPSLLAGEGSLRAGGKEVSGRVEGLLWPEEETFPGKAPRTAGRICKELGTSLLQLVPSEEKFITRFYFPAPGFAPA